MISTLDNVAGKSALPLAEIEHRCREYDAVCCNLESLIVDLEADLEKVKAKHLPALKRLAGTVAAHEAELHSAIEVNANLFQRPRTLTLWGVKVGLTASAGSLEFADEQSVISAIRKFRKDDADVLIRTTEEVNKNALRNLDTAELAKLGVHIEGKGDVVLLKRVAGDVEKLVTKLIEKLVDAMVGEGK